MSNRLVISILLAMACSVAFPALAHAQGAGDLEVFGGFSAYYTGVDVDPLGSLWLHGATGEVTWFVTDWFGVTGEIGYQSGSLEIPPGIWFCGPGVFCTGDIDFSQATFTGGARFRYPNRSRFVPSGRIVMGVGHAEASVRLGGGFLDIIDGISVDASETAFTAIFGGSLDLEVNDRIAVRLIQPDIVITTYDSADADLRLSTGLVVRF